MFTILHHFVAATDGSGSAALIQGSDDNLYGTMSSGGADNQGLVYQCNLIPSNVLVFSTDSTAVDEKAGSVTITVTRPELATGAVSVSYATADGTALTGTDYAAVSGTLSWADGDATAKTFSVALSDRGLNDGTTRTFLQVVPIGDLEGSGSRAVKLVLTSESTYTTGTMPSAKVKIKP